MLTRKPSEKYMMSGLNIAKRSRTAESNDITKKPKIAESRQIADFSRHLFANPTRDIENNYNKGLIKVGSEEEFRANMDDLYRELHLQKMKSIADGLQSYADEPVKKTTGEAKDTAPPADKSIGETKIAKKDEDKTKENKNTLQSLLTHYKLIDNGLLSKSAKFQQALDHAKNNQKNQAINTLNDFKRDLQQEITRRENEHLRRRMIGASQDMNNLNSVFPRELQQCKSSSSLNLHEMENRDKLQRQEILYKKQCIEYLMHMLEKSDGATIQKAFSDVKERDERVVKGTERLNGLPIPADNTELRVLKFALTPIEDAPLFPNFQGKQPSEVAGQIMDHVWKLTENKFRELVMKEPDKILQAELVKAEKTFKAEYKKDIMALVNENRKLQSDMEKLYEASRTAKDLAKYQLVMAIGVNFDQKMMQTTTAFNGMVGQLFRRITTF